MASSKSYILLIQSTSQIIHGAGDLVIHSFDFHGGAKLCILLNEDLLELQTAQPRKFGSWFVNQRVCSTKQFYLASKFDPRFICLKHLETAQPRYSPLNQIIVSTDGLAAFCLKNAAKLKLNEICDVNDTIDDEIVFYRYNADKTLAWLREKVMRLSSVLQKQRARQVSKTAFVSTFDSSHQNASKAESLAGNNEVQLEDTKQALDILCDYLSESQGNRLLSSYGLSRSELKEAKKSTESLKRKADWEDELELEKETLAYSSTATAAPSAKPPVKAAAPAASTASKAAASKSDKANVAAAKGTKSLFSFFGGKPKE